MNVRSEPGRLLAVGDEVRVSWACSPGWTPCSAAKRSLVEDCPLADCWQRRTAGSEQVSASRVPAASKIALLPRPRGHTRQDSGKLPVAGAGSRRHLQSSAKVGFYVAPATSAQSFSGVPMELHAECVEAVSSSPFEFGLSALSRNGASWTSLTRW